MLVVVLGFYLYNLLGNYTRLSGRLIAGYMALVHKQAFYKLMSVKSIKGPCGVFKRVLAARDTIESSLGHQRCLSDFTRDDAI